MREECGFYSVFIGLGLCIGSSNSCCYKNYEPDGQHTWPPSRRPANAAFGICRTNALKWSVRNECVLKLHFPPSDGQVDHCDVNAQKTRNSVHSHTVVQMCFENSIGKGIVRRPRQSQQVPTPGCQFEREVFRLTRL